MEHLTHQLNNVPRSYYDFVVTILSYVKEDPTRINKVSSYISDNPDATPSDILGFVIEQPGFFDDETSEFVNVFKEAGFKVVYSHIKLVNAIF